MKRSRRGPIIREEANTEANEITHCKRRKMRAMRKKERYLY